MRRFMVASKPIALWATFMLMMFGRELQNQHYVNNAQMCWWIAMGLLAYRIAIDRQEA